MTTTRLRSGVAAAAILVGGVALGGNAQADVITFENFANAFDLIANSPVGDGTDLAIPGSPVRFSVSGNGLESDSAFVFDTDEPLNTDTGPAGDTDMQQPFQDVDNPGAGFVFDPGNVAVIGNINNDGGVDDTNNPGTLTFTLSEEVDFVSFQVFDVGDDSGDFSWTIFAADGSTVLDNGSVGGVGNNQYKTISVAATGGNQKIGAFRFSGSGGIDNIQFTRGDGDVPEPGTLGVLGIGLAGLGWAARRRRKAA